ncbi:MAG: 2-hydroxychromene-2-carboxylate isomerase [Myxococcota bacterium]
MPTLEFYFDYASPFAYLASTQLGRLRSIGVDVVYRPFLLGGLFRKIGTPLVPIAEMSEAKRNYTLLDMKRWAAHWGVRFEFPKAFPLRTVRPLRLTLLLSGEEQVAFVDGVMAAAWAKNQDPSDPDVLREVMTSAGIDPGLLDREKEGKQPLFEATDEAELRKVFGVPTFIVGEQLYFGQDRLPLVENALARSETARA